MKDGLDLPHPILEHYLKSDHLVLPLLNEYHAVALGLATPEELRLVNRMALKVNVVLKSFFERQNLKLVDFTLNSVVTTSTFFWGTRSLPTPVGFGTLGQTRDTTLNIFDKIWTACVKSTRKSGTGCSRG
jgi:phosphoribosylaminoimidazole-succinocarboxamide synthase